MKSGLAALRDFTICTTHLSHVFGIQNVATVRAQKNKCKISSAKLFHFISGVITAIIMVGISAREAITDTAVVVVVVTTTIPRKEPFRARLKEANTIQRKCMLPSPRSSVESIKKLVDLANDLFRRLP